MDPVWDQVMLVRVSLLKQTHPTASWGAQGSVILVQIDVADDSAVHIFIFRYWYLKLMQAIFAFYHNIIEKFLFVLPYSNIFPQ